MNDRIAVEPPRAERSGVDRRQLEQWAQGELVPVPEHRGVHDLFERLARVMPDAEAVLGPRPLSYADLLERSGQIARALCAQGVGRGDVVGLWLNDPNDCVTACMAVWRAGAAFVPIDETLPIERVQFLLEDSRARGLISEPSLLARLPNPPACCVRFDAPEPAPDAALPDVDPDDLAYVIYTSGSTGRPKGVMVRHRNLVSWVVARSRMYGAAPRTMPIHSWSFDPTVGSAAFALATGGAVRMVDAETRRDPEVLRGLIARHDITHISAVPALYAALLHDAAPGELSSLRGCSLGGERLPSALALVHNAKLPHAQLGNEYGPTETTISCTWFPVPRAGVPDPLPIGRPMVNTRCYVLDEQLRMVAPGEPGELCIGGAGVGAGYLNRPELTAERFPRDPFCGDDNARMYRTGDRVRWLPDGQLEFLGRIDFQVKVRGYRVELGEIEHAICGCEGVRAAVVVVRDRGAAGNELIAYYETADGAARSELGATLAKSLPPYMVPAVFVHLPELPLNTSGKVDRRALPAPPDEPAVRGDASTPAQTRTEIAIAEIWCEVLSVPQVGREDSFFALGGNSLSAMMVVARVREKLGLRVPVSCLFGAPVLHELAAAIERDGQPVVRGRFEMSAEDLGSVPIAPLQETFWYLAQIDPTSAAYVVGSRFNIRGPLDPARLERALLRVVAENDILRTRFVLLHGEPVQVVVPMLSVPIAQHDLRGHADPEAEARAHLRELVHRPFDLGACPLLRCQLLRVDDDTHVLGLAVHHIVFDGWSVSLLLQRLFAAYATPDAAPNAPAPGELYRQHAHLARTRLAGVRLEQLRSYWREQLRDLPPPLSLRPDVRPAGGEQRRGGASVHGKLSPELMQRLRARCAELGVTHFVFNLAVFQLIVARWTGARDVVVGTPMAVRDESHLERMIGCFVNSVVLRTLVPELDESFGTLLERVKRTVFGAVAHSELPFDWLVADLRVERARHGENPLFRLFFNDIDRRGELPKAEGLTITQIRDQDPLTKFDLTFYVHEWDDHDEIELVYDPSLFSAELMQELVAQFELVMAQAVREPNLALGAYRLHSERARALLPDRSAPLSPSSGTAVLQDALFARAASHPERIAIVDGDGQLGYGELVQRVNLLARELIEAGARSGDRVAVYAERGARLVIGLLATLEAGCTFTILDPSQPAAWNRRLLQALAPRVLLSLGEGRALSSAAHEIARDVCGHVHSQAIAQHGARLEIARDADRPAYVTFTSGTTGTPKGVVGSHRPVLHFLDWYIATFGLGASERFSQLSGLGHDPLLRDVFTPLSIGATLCIPSEAMRKDPDQLGAFLHSNAISVMHLTPSLGTLISAGRARSGALPSLRLLLFGGERLRNQDVALARTYAPNARLVNCYGTTETPQVMGYHELLRDEDGRRVAPPIGRGIDGAQILVVNPHGESAGIAEAGTIQVRSPYLSLGYLGAENTGTRDVYATGDLGYYDSEGRVCFLGRDDRQAKVRGYRVELGAIEAALEALPGITRAHVIAHEASDGVTALQAYVVTPADAPRDAAKLRAALQATFVEAMVPSAFAFLDKLPLTANGKVDQRRLLAEQTAQPVAKRAYEEPRNQTEEVIATLWAELFELERVGIDDDFFELGGHSLLAVRMTGTLSERLGTAVPLALLMQHSTVRALASALHEAGNIAEEKLVVELRTGGTRPPFWLIHPVGGHVVFGRRFVALLDREQNVLGIQAQGLDGRKEPFTSLHDMARHYLELIRSYQPSGPYYIGGPSLGGKVCYEIAQQLIAAGEEPALVVLFDTLAPGFPRAKSAVGWLGDKVKQARDEGIRSIAARITKRALGRSAPRGYVNYEPEELTEPFAASVKKVIEANQRASRAYEVKPYPGVITMFRAKQVPDWRGMDFSDLTNGWGRFAKRVDVEVVDSTHQFMFDEPAVRELATKFRSCLHRAQQRQAMRASRISTMGGRISRLTNPALPPATARRRSE